VAYRDRTEAGGKPAQSAVSIFLVNRGHSRYVRDNQISLRLPGVKIVSPGSMSFLLEELEESGFFDRAVPSQSLAAALTSRPASQVVVLERDGEVQILAGVMPRPGDAESIEGARDFSRIKMALIRTSQEQTSYQVVPNREGSDYFRSQQERLKKKKTDTEGDR
jgi:hypothetical protein